MRLHDGFEFYARNQPGAPYAIHDDREVSYDDANRQANQLADALRDAGVGRGDRFAFLSKNSVEMAVMFIGAWKAGAVVVPLNYRLAPPEWRYIIADAGCRAVLASSEFAAQLDGLRPELGDVGTWVGVGDPASPTSGPELPDGWADYSEWISGRPETDPRHQISESHRRRVP